MSCLHKNAITRTNYFPNSNSAIQDKCENFRKSDKDKCNSKLSDKSQGLDSYASPLATDANGNVFEMAPQYSPPTHLWGPLPSDGAAGTGNRLNKKRKFPFQIPFCKVFISRNVMILAPSPIFIN
ncbi:hypothetical protein JTE90_026153 [Oedothorax gibbosus]|uniref:Uncharacterized protein n=1 Tax=Oedothorax gibbosus TaxID=931172 RepID=A0AAV6UZG3_9ARAC|nr:hypothetical protein JTE90_026153 [Oedothorax gibbosus]